MRSVENERVLSVDHFTAIDITTRLLKVVVRNGKSSQDSPSILLIYSNSTCEVLMLVVRNVTRRKLRLTHFVIVSIIDD